MYQVCLRLIVLASLLAISSCSLQNNQHGFTSMESTYRTRLAQARLSHQLSGDAGWLSELPGNDPSAQSGLQFQPAAVPSLFQVSREGRVQGYVDQNINYMIVCDGDCTSQPESDHLAMQPVAAVPQPTHASAMGAQRATLSPARVVSIRASVLRGLNEVLLDSQQIVYADTSMEHVFWGHLLDLRSGEDLTVTRYSQLGRISWASLPLSDAERQVRGDGRQRLAVFSDPDCTDCQRFEEKILQSIDNATIYTFRMAPALSRNRGGMLDPAAAPSQRRNLVSRQKIARNRQLAAKLGVDASPTLVFSNGRMVVFSGFSRSVYDFMPSLLKFWLNDI